MSYSVIDCLVVFVDWDKHVRVPYMFLYERPMALKLYVLLLAFRCKFRMVLLQSVAISS